MPDYKALYFALFRETERARRVLEQAQQAAEAGYLAQAAPPVRLARPQEAGPDAGAVPGASPSAEGGSCPPARPRADT